MEISCLCALLCIYAVSRAEIMQRANQLLNYFLFKYHLLYIFQKYVGIKRWKLKENNLWENYKKKFEKHKWKISFKSIKINKIESEIKRSKILSINLTFIIKLQIFMQIYNCILHILNKYRKFLLHFYFINFIKEGIIFHTKRKRK